MANRKHVKLINKGPQAWNEWRRGNRDTKPDLSGADLSGADLAEADLSNADLSNADLSDADLRGADLILATLFEANLRGATLFEANLRQADLLEANLSGANLSNADLGLTRFIRTDLRWANLSGAFLVAANLNGAVLSGANFSRVEIHDTIFTNCDLSSVTGLESVRHQGPSTINFDTLLNRGNNLPEVFLRGVGLPEILMTYIPSLISRPIEFYSCFISYSHNDKAFARRLHDALQGRGIRCWLDEHQVLPGDKLYTEVDRGIRLWDKVLLCCSKDALTSWWVDNEIKIAFDKEQHLWRERGKAVLALIPLDLDEYLFSGKWASGLATEVKSRLAAKFNGWEHDNKIFEEEIERLVKALRTDSSGKEPPPSPQL